MKKFGWLEYAAFAVVGVWATSAFVNLVAEPTQAEASSVMVDVSDLGPIPAPTKPGFEHYSPSMTNLPGTEGRRFVYASLCFGGSAGGDGAMLPRCEQGQITMFEAKIELIDDILEDTFPVMCVRAESNGFPVITRHTIDFYDGDICMMANY